MMMLRCVGTALALAGCSAFTPSNTPNMNGDYVLSKTPGVCALTLYHPPCTDQLSLTGHCAGGG
jgi:hypothetical protein